MFNQRVAAMDSGNEIRVSIRGADVTPVDLDAITPGQDPKADWIEQMEAIGLLSPSEALESHLKLCPDRGMPEAHWLDGYITGREISLMAVGAQMPREIDPCQVEFNFAA